MVLTVFLLALAAVFFWAGFLQPPSTWRHRSQAAFVVAVALAGVAGFFAWREARTIGELAEIIPPLPAISEVVYIPTGAETAAISAMLAAMPGRFTTAEERRGLAQRTQETAEHPDYWLIKTPLSEDSVLAFHRASAPSRGWTVETDEAPWLLLARGAERFAVFATDDWPRPRTKVLYIHGADR